MNPLVKQRFSEYPQKIQKNLLDLRKLIFEVAKENKELIGGIEETLKWGEPSYLPKKKNVGTTIRLGSLKTTSTQYALYVHCQTSLISDFKFMFEDLFDYNGNRGIIFNDGEKLPKKELKQCILMALTYHLKKI